MHLVQHAAWFSDGFGENLTACCIKNEYLATRGENICKPEIEFIQHRIRKCGLEPKRGGSLPRQFHNVGNGASTIKIKLTVAVVQPFARWIGIGVGVGMRFCAVSMPWHDFQVGEIQAIRGALNFESGIVAFLVGIPKLYLKVAPYR